MVNRKQAELEFIYKTALNTDPDVIESLFLEVIFPHGKKKHWCRLHVQTIKSKHCYVY